MMRGPFLRFGNRNADGPSLVHALIKQRVGDSDGLGAHFSRQMAHRGGVGAGISRHGQFGQLLVIRPGSRYQCALHMRLANDLNTCKMDAEIERQRIRVG